MEMHISKSVSVQSREWQDEKRSYVGNPSGIIDFGATSSCNRLVDPFKQTGEFSQKQFQVLTGQIVLATKSAML